MSEFDQRYQKVEHQTNIVYQTSGPSGETLLKNGAHALRQREYALARQLLKDAIKTISTIEHPEDAAKARYLLALASLDGKLPRVQGKTTMEQVEQLMNASIALHSSRAYLWTFAQIKGNFFTYCGYRSRLGEVRALLDQAGRVTNSSYDNELLSFFEHCQPELSHSRERYQ